MLAETYLRGRITGALGGRAAEEVTYGDVTTGAENDMEHANQIARQMAGRWGMSPTIAPVSVLAAPGQESPYGDGVAPATRELVDTETRLQVLVKEIWQVTAPDQPQESPAPAACSDHHPGTAGVRGKG